MVTAERGKAVRMRHLPAFVLALLLASACAHASGVPGARAEVPETPVPPVVFVDRDATWRGEVRIDGIVHVRKGATLTLLPGTRVVFGTARFVEGDIHEGFAGTGMKVEGRIVAEGTEEAPIVFTSASAPPAPASWDKILFTFSDGNRFSRCLFEGARYAVHAHFSEIVVTGSVFKDNEEGVRLGTSKVRIEDSVFTRNLVRGINFRECRNEIRRNLVFENGDGIFLHSKDAASLIRENAVYANRGFDLRLGDLHADDIDVSGNWWGTPREEEALAKVYDGRRLAGIGTARLAPVLPRPPVSGAEIRGVFAMHMTPVAGGEVRAYASAGEGFRVDGYVASALTDANGLFRLPVPPGRYFVAGSAESAAGTLFAFPGKNPVTVALRETVEIGLPAVVAPPRAAPVPSPSGRPFIAVRTTLSGRPAEGVTVQAFRAGAPDLRGAGEATAVTGPDGAATLYLPPGRYHLAARRRTSGEPLGMVDDGGLFGVYPDSPVTLLPGKSLTVEIPLFEKRGLLAGGEETERGAAAAALEGMASVDGRPAGGYVVYFYRPAETIGRPVARSSAAGGDGGFTVAPLPPGEYAAFLRRSIPGTPGGVEEERIGPVPVRVDGGRLVPSVLSFGAAGRP